jgi:hypothetical protein
VTGDRPTYIDKTRLQKRLDMLDNAWGMGDEAVTTNELKLGEIR